jgi:hypothetical protein
MLDTLPVLSQTVHVLSNGLLLHASGEGVGALCFCSLSHVRPPIQLLTTMAEERTDLTQGELLGGDARLLPCAHCGRLNAVSADDSPNCCDSSPVMVPPELRRGIEERYQADCAWIAAQTFQPTQKRRRNPWDRDGA